MARDGNFNKFKSGVMRSKSPWRSPTGGRPESIVIFPKRQLPPAPATSWWTKYASADTPFKTFSAAASARDAEMAASPEWRRLKVYSVIRARWAPRDEDEER